MWEMNDKKEQIKKIFTDKNMKVIIPIITLIVLLIVVFIYWSVYKYNNYRNKQNINFYQYFAGSKIEYESTVSFNKKKVIKAYVPKTYTVNFDSTPAYATGIDDDIVVFPSNMSIVFPIKSGQQFKTPEFSYIKKINDLQYLTFEDYHKNIDHYFLYDGKDLYFFSDEVTFTANGKEIKLSPLSYLIATNGDVRYYDYETDTFDYISTNEIITVSNKYYTVNVTNDNIVYPNDVRLLISNFDYLNILDKEY